MKRHYSAPNHLHGFEIGPREKYGLAILLALTFAATPEGQQKARHPGIGRLEEGAAVIPTLQLLRPAGVWVDVPGRPRDMVLSQDGRFLYVKNLSRSQHLSLAVIDVDRRELVQLLEDSNEAHSYHGIALSGDGRRLYTSVDESGIWEAKVGPDGKISWSRKIALQARPDKTYLGAGGIALDDEKNLAYVCISRANRLAVVDFTSGREVASIPVGVAPYAIVLDRRARLAFVSNWGGRRPGRDERKVDAQGIEILIDERGIASSGTVSEVDLRRQKQIAEIPTGLHPTELALDQKQGLLYVCNANEDTVSVVDFAQRKVIETINVRLCADQPFGSAPNALALSPDGLRLFVANGGNNAVAVIRLGHNRRAGADASRVEGFIPTAWYPARVIIRGDRLYVANLKGWGSLDRPAEQKGFHVRDVLGTITMVKVPDTETLASYTRGVYQDANLPQALRALEKANSKTAPIPVPQRTGEPSLFEHVVYIIKENRTYDQVLGDMTQGNGDPSLCIFPRNVTPNHHALAEEFVLLDNFYCNSLYSADGHAWITEANTTDYMEKSRANLVWGDNPLSYSSSGFLWTHILNHGLSFENFGEYAYTDYQPETASYSDIYSRRLKGKSPVRFRQRMSIAALRPYTVKDFPGWNLNVPDSLRADIFLRKLKEHERSGSFPNFTILYLPNDHTAGTRENMPTPRSYLADNDLALGRCIEAISKGRFWKNTCVFVVEDDPQDGFDHVDGHRSVALVVSPYTRRRSAVSTRYNQTSLVRTIELILGIRPMTQFDAMAPHMWDVFQTQADLTPYTARPAQVPLLEMNPPAAQLKGRARYWAERSKQQDFERVDAADEETLNRILWHNMKGVDARFPEEFTNWGRKRKSGLPLNRE